MASDLQRWSNEPHSDFPMPVLRHVAICGTPPSPKLVEKWIYGNQRFVSRVHGYAETTASVCRHLLGNYHNAKSAEAIPIGAPTCNTTVLVVDPFSAQPSPLYFGNYGELCVAGEQVAVRYWENDCDKKNCLDEDEAIAPRFVTMEVDGVLRRCYRTGDLCRIDARTKQVHFYGRCDAVMHVTGNTVVEMSKLSALFGDWFRTESGGERKETEYEIAKRGEEVAVGIFSSLACLM